MRESLTMIQAHRLRTFLRKYIVLDRYSIVFYGCDYYASCLSSLLSQKVFDSKETLKRKCKKETGLLLPDWIFEEY